MVVAGVVSVAVAIAAFFVGVLLLLIAAIVFTVAFVAALAITIGLLIVAFSVAAVLLVGPIVLFLGALVFLVSAVLGLAHRRGRPRPARWVGDPAALPASRSAVASTRLRPHPHRPLVPKGLVGARRVVRIVLPVRSPRAAPSTDPLELDPAQAELERV